VLKGDLFSPLPAGCRFDVITSNPPYVTRDEIPKLAADVRDHEPRTALDGGQDGLDVIRQIVEQSPSFLNEGGWLMFELSPEQADAALELLRQRGFQETTIRYDLAGQARVAIGRWKETITH
jgi:release factor glutamine methyltransferase